MDARYKWKWNYTSLENGFGQEINKTTKNGLGVLQVHNVVSDENGTTINISLDLDHDHSISCSRI